MSHKLAVGEAVAFMPDPGEVTNGQAMMATIVRLLPMQGTEYHYHIQVETDGLQRRVRESQLRPT
jgi:hypothetical protein